MKKKHKGLPVAGYVDQSGQNVALVNENKEMEERVLRRIEQLAKADDHDKRMLALANTHVQTAFMFLNRAVFRPSRVRLPEDAIQEDDGA